MHGNLEENIFEKCRQNSHSEYTVKEDDVKDFILNSYEDFFTVNKADMTKIFNDYIPIMNTNEDKRISMSAWKQLVIQRLHSCSILNDGNNSLNLKMFPDGTIMLVEKNGRLVIVEKSLVTKEQECATVLPIVVDVLKSLKAASGEVLCFSGREKDIWSEGIFTRGQKYSITLQLEMPDSQPNKDLGMFQVCELTSQYGTSVRIHGIHV